MTAPDPGLTDLIAAHYTWREVDEGGDYLVCACGHYFASRQTWAEHLKLVVEQPTNGPITELRDVKAERDVLKATIARVEKALAEGPLHRIDFPSSKDPYGIERQTIRAALEGPPNADPT